MDGYHFVVFTNSLGQHRLAWRGQLLDADLDLSRMGDLAVPDDVSDQFGNARNRPAAPCPPDTRIAKIGPKDCGACRARPSSRSLYRAAMC
jgi:hypothetical protein